MWEREARLSPTSARVPGPCVSCSSSSSSDESLKVDGQRMTAWVWKRQVCLLAACDCKISRAFVEDGAIKSPDPVVLLALANYEHSTVAAGIIESPSTPSIVAEFFPCSLVLPLQPSVGAMGTCIDYRLVAED
eukprot:661923-Prymnesium_polylepis.1